MVNTLYPDKYQAQSAGTISTKVNPFAIHVMKEIGIDISNHRSKSIEEFRGKVFDLVVTICDNARETCPFLPGKEVIHKSFNDPSAAKGTDKVKLQIFRKIRDEIKNWLENDFLLGDRI